MQFFIISHFFFGKVNLGIKMGLSCLENKCHRISKMSVLPSLRTKLLLYVRHETPSMSSFKAKIISKFSCLGGQKSFMGVLVI